MKFLKSLNLSTYLFIFLFSCVNIKSDVKMEDVKIRSSSDDLRVKKEISNDVDFSFDEKAKQIVMTVHVPTIIKDSLQITEMREKRMQEIREMSEKFTPRVKALEEKKKDIEKKAKSQMISEEALMKAVQEIQEEEMKLGMEVQEIQRRNMQVDNELQLEMLEIVNKAINEVQSTKFKKLKESNTVVCLLPVELNTFPEDYNATDLVLKTMNESYSKSKKDKKILKK